MLRSLRRVRQSLTLLAPSILLIGLYQNFSTTATSPVIDSLSENFESAAPGWHVTAPATNPNVKGLISYTPTDGSTGRALKFEYDLSASTPPTDYVGVASPLLSLIEGSVVKLWLKSDSGIQINIRIVDSSGQAFRYIPPRPFLAANNSNTWYPVVFQLDQKYTPGSFAGGDGVIHYPVKELRVYATKHANAAAAKGTFYLDNVSLMRGPLADFQQPPVANIGIARGDTPFDPKGMTLGISLHNINDARQLDIAKSAGFQIVRSDLKWAYVEKQKGVYDFSAYDSFVRNLRARGLKTLFILCYSNILYSGHTGQTYGPDESTTRNAYFKFVAEVAKHYKDSADIQYEIWNEENSKKFWEPEPNPANYALLLSGALESMRAVDPSAKIYSGGLSYFDYSFAQGFFPTSKLANLGDGFGIHPYRPSDIPETVVNDYLQIKRITGTLPVVTTEWGHTSYDFDAQNAHSTEALNGQARLSVRQILSTWLAGSTLSVYYDLVDDSSSSTDRESNFGLVNTSYVDKPAMKALRTLKEEVAGLRYDGTIPTLGSALNAIRFVHPNATDSGLYIVWATARESSMTIVLPSDAVVRDMYGDSVATDASSSGGRKLVVEETKGLYYISTSRLAGPTADAGRVTVYPLASAVTTAVQGQAATVNFKFSVDRIKVSKDYSAFVHVVDSNGKIALQADYNSESSNWSGAETVQRTLKIPDTMAAGTYSIVTGLYQKESTGAFTNVLLKMASGVTEVSPRRYQVGTLKVVDPIVADTGKVSLEGLNPSTLTAKRGTSSTLNLKFKVSANLSANYSVLVHVLRADGSIAFQSDFSPVTKTWSGSVTAPRTFVIPASLPAGTYRIMTGLYLQKSNSSFVRLPLTPINGAKAQSNSYYQVGNLQVTN